MIDYMLCLSVTLESIGKQLKDSFFKSKQTPFEPLRVYLCLVADRFASTMNPTIMVLKDCVYTSIDV